MAKQITKTVYTLAELIDLEKQGKVKSRHVERAKQTLREWATTDDWYSYVYELWINVLEQLGFTEPQINFSGFASQGDGASFTVKRVDLEKLIDFLSSDIPASEAIDDDGKDGNKLRPYAVHELGNTQTTEPKYRKLLGAINYISASVNRTSHQYSHEHTCRFEGDIFGPCDKTPRVRKLFDEFCADAEALRLKLSRVIYKALQEEYDHLTSDEFILQDAAERELTFTITGEVEG